MKKIKIGNIEITGTDCRSIFGLRSAKFEVSIEGDNIKFSVTGYGHGVGLSQCGADSLAKQGYVDISFIAQDTSSYLKDKHIDSGLLKLINAIEAQGALISARFLYLYPSSTSFDLLDSIAESKIFQNYYDMPIQHISQTVLQDMRRNHRDVKQLLSYMKNIPNSFIRSSIIVGYPTEKDKDFEELCEFLEEFKFDRLNVFEYSKEEGTKAATLQELPRNIRTKRIRTIQAIIAKNQYELLQSLVDSTIECIIEGKSEISPYFYSARDKRWAKEIDGEILINDGDYSGIGYYNVAITECRDNILVGRIVDAV